MNPLANTSWFIDPKNPASRSEIPELSVIANQPYTYWYVDQYKRQRIKNRVSRLISRHEDHTPIIVLYNIPNRDLGNHSKGGARNGKEYLEFVSEFAAGIGNKKPIVILEPDALASCQNMKVPSRMARIKTIRDAIGILTENTNALVYVDIGNPEYIVDPSAAGKILSDVGAERTCGFSLNVSNYYSTELCEEYGRKVAAAFDSLHFIIDTGRNGNGNINKEEWCNAMGRKIGQFPTLNTNDPLCDAYLWIKPPAESDGPCNGGPKAGVFWNEYALGLCRG